MPEMEDFVFNRYIRMFDLLDVETKLELLAKLTENINKSFKRQTTDKYKLLDTLCGAWGDVDDGIVEDIYHARTTSDKAINFD